METAADDAGAGGQRTTEHDVGKLTDRRVRQPRLEIVLAHGHQGRQQQGRRRHPHEPDAGSGAGQEVDAENIDDGGSMVSG